MNIFWLDSDVVHRCSGYWGAKEILLKKPEGATHVHTNSSFTYQKIDNEELYKWNGNEWLKQNLRVVSIQTLLNLSINLRTLENRILVIEKSLTGIESIGWNNQVISPMDACVWVDEHNTTGNDYLIFPLKFFDSYKADFKKYFARCVQPQIDFHAGTYSSNGLRKAFPEELKRGRRIYKTAKDVRAHLNKVAFDKFYNINPFK